MEPFSRGLSHGTRRVLPRADLSILVDSLVSQLEAKWESELSSAAKLAPASAPHAGV